MVRPFLILLALLSLAVRWGDAACGCAAHNHWTSLSSSRHGEDHDHCPDHGSPANPAIEHGCVGEVGEAVYPAGLRTFSTESVAGPPSGIFRDLAAAEFASWRDRPAPGGPRSRATLNVYRI